MIATWGSRRRKASLIVYYGKSAAVVLILSKEASKQLGLSVVTGDDTTLVFSQCERAAKSFVVASERGYGNFVCTHSQRRS